MAADDFDVVVFKVLACLRQCIKDGMEPNPDKAPFSGSAELIGNQNML